MNITVAIVISIIGLLQPGMKLVDFDRESWIATIELSTELISGSDQDCEIVWDTVRDILSQKFAPKKVLLVSPTGWVPLAINPIDIGDMLVLKNTPEMAWGD